MRDRGVRGIRPRFRGLSPCGGQVAYVLLTSAPVAARRVATPAMPLDLHVLSLSLAFILSQDQTLRCCILVFFSLDKKALSSHTREGPQTPACVRTVFVYLLSQGVILDGSGRLEDGAPLSLVFLCTTSVVAKHVNDRRSMRLVFGAKAVQNYNHFLNYQNFFALFLKKKFTTKNKSTPIYIIIYNLLLSQQRFSCPGANRRLTPPQRKKFFEKR